MKSPRNNLYPVRSQTLPRRLMVRFVIDAPHEILPSGIRKVMGHTWWIEPRVTDDATVLPSCPSVDFVIGLPLKFCLRVSGK